MSPEQSFVKNFLSGSSFYILNKSVCKTLKPNASVLLTLLIDRFNYWQEKGRLVDGEWFYKSKEEIEEDVNLTAREQDTAIEVLVDFGLIDTKEGVGFNRTKHYRINWCNVSEFLTSGSKNVNDFPLREKRMIDHAENADSIMRKTRTTNNTTKNTKLKTENSKIQGEEVDQSPRIEKVSKIEKIEVPSFKDMTLLLKAELNRVPRQPEIMAFVSSCKDNGLTSDDISTRTFLNTFFDSAPAMKKSMGGPKFTEWRNHVESKLEQAKAVVYFGGSLDLDSEPEGVEGKFTYNKQGDMVLDEKTFNDLFADFLVKE